MCWVAALRVTEQEKSDIVLNFNIFCYFHRLIRWGIINSATVLRELRVKALRILAGHQAREQIAQHGLQPALFDRFIAASGGPKWLPLAALDRHLLTRWVPQAQPMELLGTSSGGWRCAALCHPQPEAAHRRLQQAYINQRYEQYPSEQEVRDNCLGIIEALVAEVGLAALLAQPTRTLNLIACRWKGMRNHSRPRQMANLGLTALVNLISRSGLELLWERWLFSAGGAAFEPLGGLTTHPARLTPANLEAALLATGSIPMLSPGELDIDGARPGRYMDGGITDYHLDFPVLGQGKLVLYPHFNPFVLPGWFDKSLSWRRAGTNLSNVVLLVPSPEFVASLPGARIPDRGDFKRYDNEQRIALWNRCCQQGQALVNGFQQAVAEGQRVEIEKLD